MANHVIWFFTCKIGLQGLRFLCGMWDKISSTISLLCILPLWVCICTYSVCHLPCQNMAKSAVFPECQLPHFLSEWHHFSGKSWVLPFCYIKVENFYSNFRSFSRQNKNVLVMNGQLFCPEKWHRLRKVVRWHFLQNTCDIKSFGLSERRPHFFTQINLTMFRSRYIKKR